VIRFSGANGEWSDCLVLDRRWGSGPEWRTCFAVSTNRLSTDLAACTKEHLSDLLASAHAHAVEKSDELHGDVVEEAEGWRGFEERADGLAVRRASHFVNPASDGLRIDQKGLRRVVVREAVGRDEDEIRKRSSGE
jgi:hypothetical protein